MQQSTLLPWSPKCQRPTEAGSIKLMGITNGTRLRPAPGGNKVIVTVDAVGGTGQHYWLLDGKQTSNGAVKAKQRQRFEIHQAGQHRITVIDAAGHVDSVVFGVDGGR